MLQRFKPGSLIDVCLDFFGFPGQPRRLSPKNGLPDRERLRLQRFLSGVRVMTEAGGNRSLRPIRKLSAQGAADMRFALREGGTKTVAVCIVCHQTVLIGSHFATSRLTLGKRIMSDWSILMLFALR